MELRAILLPEATKKNRKIMNIVVCSYEEAARIHPTQAQDEQGMEKHDTHHQKLDTCTSAHVYFSHYHFGFTTIVKIVTIFYISKSTATKITPFLFGIIWVADQCWF